MAVRCVLPTVPQQQEVPCGEILQLPLLRPGAKICRNTTRLHTGREVQVHKMCPSHSQCVVGLGSSKQNGVG